MNNFQVNSSVRMSAETVTQMILSFDNYRLTVELNLWREAEGESPDTYRYFSCDSDTDSSPVAATKLMTLPEAICYAYEFFGVIPTGTVDDLFPA